MAKKANKAKKSIDTKQLMVKLKTNLDPKEWAKKIRFKNENARRIGEMYMTIAGIGIIIITATTIIFPIYPNYPFNFTETEKVQVEISKAELKATDIETKTAEAVEQEIEVTKEKDNLLNVTKFMPVKVEPFSFLMYLDGIGKKHNVEISNIVLPENRRSAVLTNDINITATGEQTTTVPTTETSTTETVPVQDNGTTVGTVLTPTDQVVDPNAPQTAEGEKKEVKTEENAYTIDIKVVGMYSELTKFFKDLENTRQIISMSDMKISEFKPEVVEGEESANQLEENIIKIDINNFDMKKLKTQVTFKVKLYDSTTYNGDIVEIQEDPIVPTGGQ